MAISDFTPDLHTQQARPAPAFRIPHGSSILLCAQPQILRVILNSSVSLTPTSKLYINNPRYADDTTLMVESEEDLKSLLMKVKEESEKLA